jgi:hypothetical protein
VGEWVNKRDLFILHYPKSGFVSFVKTDRDAFLADLLRGEDNTPVFERASSNPSS